ncbi:MAG: Maf family nucleotide pyrophosphatase [Bacteroidota bacterium]
MPFANHLSLNKNYNVILASRSPRRQFLLKETGIAFGVRVRETDEEFPQELKAQEIPLFLSRKKAEAFRGELKDGELVIAADTIVWMRGQALNKPADRADALRMLRMLSGNMHEVYTGVCLMSREKTRSFYACSRVFFNPMSDEELAHYVDTCRPYDKAGAYGAQECLPAGMNPCSDEENDFLLKIGKPDLYKKEVTVSQAGSGCACVARIEGSYFNVMGLPLCELYRELREF